MQFFSSFNIWTDTESEAARVAGLVADVETEAAQKKVDYETAKQARDDTTAQEVSDRETKIQKQIDAIAAARAQKLSGVAALK